MTRALRAVLYPAGVAIIALLCAVVGMGIEHDYMTRQGSVTVSVAYGCGKIAGMELRDGYRVNPELAQCAEARKLWEGQ